MITVPADFELPQCEATKRAAQIAGLTLSPLLQEPVAAALAYGFQSQSDKVFWLVYDFGGGTFDAAVIQVRDGAIEVVNHGGDNELGGKDIDWAIVDRLLVPALTKECKLTNFKRGNSKWRAAFAKLKWHAEEAKIALSRRKSFDIDVKFSTEDNFPEPFQFEYELQQSEVATLAEPFIIKTINICKKTMTDKRLGSGNIEKVILVGGPTLTPYVRERLADSDEGLGIPLETKVDPTTVFVRGAAIFAGTQRLPGDEAALDEKRQITNAINLTSAEPTLTHSIGLALPNREYLILMVKGEPLPGWRRVSIFTKRNFHKGQEEDLIHISVLEGENQCADLNHHISTLEIKSCQVKCDIPAGSEIEVEIGSDRFHTMWTKAYIPILDEEFEVIVKMNGWIY